MNGVLLTIRCSQCRKENVVLWRESAGTTPLCRRCESPLVRICPVRGYIYILSNTCMPNLLKIGVTERDVEERVAELSAPTSVPEPFVVEAWFASEFPAQDERAIHGLFSSHRHRSRREFFQISVAEAIAIATSALGRPPQFIRSAPPTIPVSSPTIPVLKEPKRERDVVVDSTDDEVEGLSVPAMLQEVVAAYHAKAPRHRLDHLARNRDALLYAIDARLAAEFGRSDPNYEFWKSVRKYVIGSL